MNQLFSKYQLFLLAFCGIASLFFYTSCGDDNTSTEPNCTVSITNFSIAPTTFSKSSIINGTATLSGSITFQEDLGLDDNTLRSLAQQIYYSSNNTYSSNDILLTAFAPTVSHSGNKATLTIDQIELDSSIPTGAGFFIARFDPVPCSLGGSIPADEQAIAVSINN